jgi:biofilm protein TabA
MIHDTLNTLTTEQLCEWSPVFREAFEWIRGLPECPPPGITELRGRSLYVNVHGYDTLPVGQCLWESHRHTIDLQYCIAGGEIIEWGSGSGLEAQGDYHAEKDTQKWRREPPEPCTQLQMFPGTYAIFLPNELHRPKIHDGVNDGVRKLVVKISAELLKT